MDATLWASAGQAATFVVAGAGSVWARRSKSRTEDGNDTLYRIEMRQIDQGQDIRDLKVTVRDHDKAIARMRDDVR